MALNDVHRTAIAMVTCASREDMPAAAELMAGSLADGESILHMVFSLSGMVWTVVEFAAQLMSVDPVWLWEAFATSATIVADGFDARGEEA